MQAKERKETARMSWMLEDLCPGAGAAGVDGGEREREKRVGNIELGHSSFTCANLHTDPSWWKGGDLECEC